MEVNVHEAKTHWARLLRGVTDGEDVSFAHAGVPVARLVAIEPKNKVSLLGMDRGRVWVADDFDRPLPDALPATF